MKNYTMRWQFSLACLLLVSLMSWTACNEPTPLGDDWIDQDQLLNSNFTDTLSLKVFLVQSDSVITNNKDLYLLGANNDPVFGQSVASVYCQALLPGNNLALAGFSDSLYVDDLIELDSVVLAIRYITNNSIYGDTITQTQQDFNVYRLTEDLININETIIGSDTIANTQLYYGDTQLSTGEQLATYSTKFTPANATQSIEQRFEIGETFTDTILSQIRIPLADSFGEEMLAKFNDGSGVYDNDTTFLEQFKGFYIESDENNSAIATLNFASTSTTLLLYYTYRDAIYNTDGSFSGSYQNSYQDISFPIETTSSSQNSIIVNQFKHNYAGTPVDAVLMSPNQEIDEVAYLQGMTGLDLNIEIPYIENMGNILVNKAELEFTRIDRITAQEDSIYTPPEILIFTLDPELASESSANPDYIIFNSLIEDSLDTNGNPLDKYFIYSSFSIQKLISDNTKRAMNVRLRSKSIFPNNVQVGGPNHPVYPMKLNLYYTEIK